MSTLIMSTIKHATTSTGQSNNNLVGSSYHKGADDLHLYDFKTQRAITFQEFSTQQTSTKAVQQISGQPICFRAFSQHQPSSCYKNGISSLVNWLKSDEDFLY